MNSLDHGGHKVPGFNLRALNCCSSLKFRQYGGQKRNSITHYHIEFITFILSCQDSSDQTAILAVMVDFSKAFNRQNHNILITKLSDMGVPAWLLRIVMEFISDRGKGSICRIYIFLCILIV